MSLQREMLEFNKRLVANVGVNDSRKRKINAESEVCDSSTPKRLKSDDTNTNVGGNFSLLTKIVNHLKLRRQQKDFKPLSIDEILQEVSQCDVTPANKHWLVNDALPSNERIEVVGQLYSYKPEFRLKNMTDVKELIRNQFSRGIGMITRESIEDSIGKVYADKALQKCKDEIGIIKGADKKDLIFGKLRGMDTAVDDKFLQLWRTSSVKDTSEANICKMLKQQKIQAYEFKDMTGIVTDDQKKAKTTKRKNVTKQNVHIADLLD